MTSEMSPFPHFHGHWSGNPVSIKYTYLNWFFSQWDSHYHQAKY